MVNCGFAQIYEEVCVKAARMNSIDSLCARPRIFAQSFPQTLHLSPHGLAEGQELEQRDTIFITSPKILENSLLTILHGRTILQSPC